MLQNVDFFKTLLNGIKSKFQSQQKQISKHNTRLDDQQAQIEDLKNRKIDAVLYTPQTLTDEQQKQARDNIGADVGGYFEIRVTKSGDTYTVDKTYNEIKVAIESGLTPVCRMKRRAADVILDDVFYYYNWQIVDGHPDANSFTFNNMSTSISRYITIYNSDIVYYFDAMYNFYTLPTATSKTLGGVKPVAKTDVMTQDVGVDENGKLYTEPAEGGTDRSLGITGAQVGQIAKITAVDADGKPTAWSPVDMPTGGGSITDDDVTAERAFAAAATPKAAGTNQIIPTGNTIKFIAEEDGILSVTSVSLLSYAYVNKPILASDVPMYSVSSIEAGFEIAINPDYTLGTHFANGRLAFPADIKSGKSYTLRYYSSATIYLYPIDISTFAAGSLITKATEDGAIVAHFTADKDYTGIRFCVSISRGETATITKITLAEGDAPAEYNPDSNSKQVAVQAGKTYYLSDVKAKSVTGPGTFYQAPEAVLSINGLVPDNGAIKTYGTTKEFACFGDSIWAFGASTGGIGSVSDYMQALCGGIWHNLSTGGSTMATRPGTYAGAYDAFDFHALADCVASGDFSAPKAVDGATTNIANADDVSWADVDAVMIAYGTNDIAFGGTLDNDSDLYDKATVCGALRYGIKTIAAAHPTITFYVLGILYRSADSVDVKTISAWNEGLRKAAEMMGAEYVPMIGINAGNSSTYLYDGTHPNAAGKMAIAKSIARRIINL